MWWNSNVEKRLLWKHNKPANVMKFQCGKEAFCGNTINHQMLWNSKCGKETFVETQIISNCYEIPIVEKRLFVETQLIVKCCETQ